MAVELGSDSSTSSNGGAPSVLLYTVPLSFIDDPDASQLSSSISVFQLHDRTTKSIAAYNRIPSHHNPGGKIDPRFSRLARGENLAGCERRTLQASRGQLSSRQCVVPSVSYIASTSPSIGKLLLSMVGGRMPCRWMLSAYHDFLGTHVRGLTYH